MAGVAPEATITFRAMATDVTISVVGPSADTEAALGRAQAVFENVEAACTRFAETSPLMLANAEPSRWHDVPVECAAAVAAAARAHEETDGVFDPRILDALVALGYDHSMSFGSDAQPHASPAPSAMAPSAATAPPGVRRPWRPRWEIADDRCRIHLDGARIDLGGIGKGLAVRWAAEQICGAGESVMIEAGGDCQFVGSGPERTGWRVGMEDPRGGHEPLLVFELADVDARRRRSACGAGPSTAVRSITSSIRAPARAAGRACWP